MITKQDAESIEFEIELLRLVEDRLTRKVNMNSKLEGSLMHTAMNKLNIAVNLIDDLPTPSCVDGHQTKR